MTETPSKTTDEPALPAAHGSAFDLLIDLTEDPHDNGTYELHAKGAEYDAIYNATMRDANEIDALRTSLAELIDAMHRYEMDAAGECDGAPPEHREMMERAHALLPNQLL